MQEDTARHGPSTEKEFVEKEAWTDAIERFVKTVPASRRKKARGTLLGFARGPERHPDLAVRKHPEQVTKDDLEKFFGQLMQHYKDWTIHDYKLILKQFYKKRKGKRFVSWIKIPRNIRSRLGPEDLLTKEEIDRMIYAAPRLSDKAIISTLLESDFRPHEFLSLKIRNVTLDERGAILHITGGKTGPRPVRVIEATPRLAEWITNHPLRNDPDAPLWINQSTNGKNQALKQIGLRRLVKKIAKDAHVNKRIFPYLFRHTRNTELAKILTESQMKTYAGWTADSRMPAMYVHLSGRDVEPALFAAYGLEQDKDDQISKRVPKRCPRCDTMCAHDEELCHRCGMALSLQTALKAKEGEMESLKSKVQELDQLVRRNSESSALQARIMLALAQGKIVMGKPIDLSLFSEDDRDAIQNFMKSYGVPAIKVANSA